MSFLDRAYRMRSGHKEAEKLETITHPISGEPMELGEHDRQLNEIFQDKKEQDFFINKYAYNEDPEMTKDIAEALASGTLLTAEQDTFLEKTRTKYNLDRKKIEMVRESLNEEEITRIAELDPRIKEVVGKIGAEQAAELLGNEFRDFALADKKSFEKIVKALKSVKDVETSDYAKDVEKHVAESLEKYGIREEDYFNAARTGSSIETRDNLAKLAAEQYGWFKKSIDFVSGKALSMRAGRTLFIGVQEQQDLLKECDKQRAIVGRFLRGTLTADVRMAIQKHLLEGGAVHEKKELQTVTTIADYKAVKENIHTTQPRWEAYKTSETRRLNIRDLASQPAALEAMKNRFADAEIQTQKGYTAIGALGALLAFLFGMRTRDDIKNSLT